MPRNKSEKNPKPDEAPGVEPDFYNLMRIYAEKHVQRDLPTRIVRADPDRWGTAGTASRDLFNTFAHQKKEAWWNLSNKFKQAYVADYMDYLYGTQ